MTCVTALLFIEWMSCKHRMWAVTLNVKSNISNNQLLFALFSENKGKTHALTDGHNKDIELFFSLNSLTELVDHLFHFPPKKWSSLNYDLIRTATNTFSLVVSRLSGTEGCVCKRTPTVSLIHGAPQQERSAPSLDMRLYWPSDMSFELVLWRLCS